MTAMTSTNNSAVVIKGKECIKAAQMAFNLITTQKDADVAVKHLTTLKDNGRFLQEFAEEEKKRLLIKETRLNDEMANLESEKCSFESTISSLNYNKRQAESRRSSQQRLLTEAQNELRCAEDDLSSARSELRRAKEKEKGAMTASVVSGVVVGLFTFGIGGAAVGGALGAGIAALINELEGKVRRAEGKVQNKKADVERAKDELRSTEDSLDRIERDINNYRSRISSNERKKEATHDKISSVINSIAFQKEASDFWEMTTLASERATERTERLQRIVEKAAKKKNFKILGSDGTITIAESFLDAWNEVTIKEGQVMFLE